MVRSAGARACSAYPPITDEDPTKSPTATSVTPSPTADTVPAASPPGIGGCWLANAPFRNVAYDMDEPFHVYGSIQDHGSRRGVVDLKRGRNKIRPQEWEGAPGGEGSSHAIDPTNPDIVYSAGFYGTISRTDLGTKKRAKIVPKAGKREPPLRGQWVAPFIVSPHNPRIIYHGMNFLYRSMNRGDSFEKISPDLTYNDPGKIGDIAYQTLFAISESPLKFGLLYAGTDDGRAHLTRDGGRTWTSSRCVPSRSTRSTCSVGRPTSG